MAWLEMFEAQAEDGAASNGLLNNLIAFWPGDELNGDLLDAHRNALHLTDVNTVTSNPGHVYATARQYTAANSEYHTIADNALLRTGVFDWTFAGWVYLDTKATYQTILAKHDPMHREYQLYYNPTLDRLAGVGWDGSWPEEIVYANSFGAVPTATWLLVVLSNDDAGGEMQIQVNNGAIDAVAQGHQVASTAPFMIGARSNLTNFLNGRIGPTAFWKSAPGGGGVLTAEQRTALWDAGAGLKYEDLTA